MAKKEKMPLKRSEDFSQVDDALSEAMDVLDATNARVSELLQSDTESLPDTSAGGAGEETASEAEPPKDQADRGRAAAQSQSDSGG